eukprot:1515364-Karenia_brevis.AAC.1
MPLKARDLDMKELRGRRLPSNTLLYPRLRVLPMGWSHALWWCQTLHCRIISQALGLEEKQFIRDKKQTPDLTQTGWTVYVDNFLVFGTSKSSVASVTSAAQRALESRGLPTHEICVCSEKTEVLGWQIDGRLGMIRASPRRVWR